MKILLVQDRLRGGGTERQTVFLAGAFARAGHAVQLLTFRPGGVLAAHARDAGFAWRSLQPFDCGLDWFAPGLVGAARRFAPDVVLTMGRMANCYAAKLQRALAACVVVATVRTGKNLPARYRASLRAVRHVVANSEFARRTFVAPEATAGRCSVIPNALLYAPLLAAARRPAETPEILNVAQFRPEKGQRELIEAAARLSAGLPWRLVFVGDGPERAACEALVCERGLAGSVEFAGWQAAPEEFYARAAVAALTSSRESLPNFLVEAQCAGVPVVTYDVGGAAECLQPGVSGFVVPAGDVASLAAALQRVLSEPERREAMGQAAREFARNTFDPERQVRAYLTLFERLVAP